MGLAMHFKLSKTKKKQKRKKGNKLETNKTEAEPKANQANGGQNASRC